MTMVTAVFGERDTKMGVVEVETSMWTVIPNHDDGECEAKWLKMAGR